MGCGGTALIASRTGARVVLLPLLADPTRIDAAELDAAKTAARGLGVGFKVAEALVSAPGRTAEVLHRVVAELAPAALYAESLLDKEAGLSQGGRRQLQTIQLAIDDVQVRATHGARKHANENLSRSRRRPCRFNLVQRFAGLLEKHGAHE